MKRIPSHLTDSLDEIKSLPSDQSRSKKGPASTLSSMYEMPYDKPLGLDVSKFLQPSTDSIYTGNDIDLIQEAMKQHSTLVNVLHKRKSNVR